MTELTNKEIENALTLGDVTSLWNLVKTIDEEEIDDEDLIENIKNGFDVKFDIRLVTKGYYEEKPQYDIVILGKVKQINLGEFWNEIEKREKAMKDILRELYDGTFDKQVEPHLEGYNEN